MYLSFKLIKTNTAKTVITEKKHNFLGGATAPAFYPMLRP